MASSSNTDDNSKIDELMKWATALRPDTLDLFSDFGGANVFIIDIDALILELFCDKHLLWQKGAQTLHAVYLVEQALHNFSVRGGLFEVVCFTESSNIIWKKFGPNRLFAREVILLHLRQGIKHPFKTFTTWWSQEFKDYLQAVQPSFVTVATGFETFAQKKNEFGFEDPMKTMIAPFILTQALYLLSIKQNVVLCENYFPTSNRVDAFCLTPANSRLARDISDTQKVNIRSFLPSLMTMVEEELSRTKMPTVDVDVSMFATAWESLKSTDAPLSLAFSVAMFGNVLKNKMVPANSGLAAPGVLADVIRVYMLHHALLATIPVDKRLNMDQFDREAPNTLTKAVAEALKMFFFSMGIQIVRSIRNSDEFIKIMCTDSSWSMLDLLDGRFLSALASHITSDMQGPPELLKNVLDKSWECIRATPAGADLPASFGWISPANIKASEPKVEGELAKLWSVDLKIVTMPLVALDNHFLAQYFEKLDVRSMRGAHVHHDDDDEEDDDEDVKGKTKAAPKAKPKEDEEPEVVAAPIVVEEASDEIWADDVEATANSVESVDDIIDDWEAGLDKVEVKKTMPVVVQGKTVDKLVKRRKYISGVEVKMDPFNSGPIFIDVTWNFLSQNLYSSEEVNVAVEDLQELLDDMADVFADESNQFDVKEGRGITKLSDKGDDYTKDKVHDLFRLRLADRCVNEEGKIVDRLELMKGLTIDDAADVIDTDALLRLEHGYTGLYDPELFSFGVERQGAEDKEEKAAKQAKGKWVRTRRGRRLMTDAEAQRHQNVKDYAVSMSVKTTHQRVMIRGSLKQVEEPEKDESKEKEDVKEKKGKGGGGKAKAKGPSVKEQIQMDNQKKADDKLRADENSKLKNMIAWIDEERTMEIKIDKLQNQYIPRLSLKEVQLEGYMYLLKLATSAWKTETIPRNIAHVFRIAHDLYTVYNKYMNRSIMQELYDTLCLVGFPRSAALMVNEAPSHLTLPSVPNYREVATGRPLPGDNSITESRFQMKYMGEYMERDTKSCVDSRVSFMPDDWQVKMLDVVDANESALVIAPTSAGKTFVSFYVMEKIIKGDAESMVIYVCPAKALLNQVASEVYAKFGQTKYTTPGKTVFGILGADFKFNPLKCQVLITVPDALETLLLSPQYGSMLIKKTKYVIFDEVHCAGEFQGGEIWKHLLMIVTCPYIALSATIGNPEEFYDWLKLTQYNHNRKIQMIVHPHRYSDLRRWVYFPKNIKLPQFIQYADYKTMGVLQDLHPCAPLTIADLQHGFPVDLAFEPKDSVELYDAMKAVYKTDESLSKLDPDKYFRKTKSITQKQAREYAAKLKKLLEQWLKLGYTDRVNAVLTRVGGGKLQKYYLESEADFPDSDVSKTEEFLNDHFVELLMYLYNDDKLPAIAFCFDKTRCENLVIQVAQQLEDLEMQYNKEHDIEFRRQERERNKKEKEVKRSRDKKLTKKEEEQKKKEAADAGVSGEAEIPDEPDIDNRFSFAQEGVGMGIDEREARIKRLEERGGEVKPALIKALKRGIGAHHPDLPKKYRQLVEMLFRGGYLRVIVSTQSLALGINVPCRTTVFAGDSNFLNALYYRQMGGRAGRRGFDVLGHTVFFGVPFIKVRRLLTSPVPVLHGHFALSATFITRLMQFLERSTGTDALHNKRICYNVLTQPNSGMAHTPIPNQLKYHTRYMIATLVKLGVLLPNGFPTRLSVFPSLLHEQNPGNLLFMSLLQQGVLHAVCKVSKNEPEKAVINLLHVLSYCFCRRTLPFMARFGDTRAILPPLPKEVEDAVNRYNVRVGDIMSHYLLSFCGAYASELPDPYVLPETGLKLANNKQDLGGAWSRLTQSNDDKLVTVRHPCQSTSGHGWRFNDLRDFLESSRPGFVVDHTSVPLVLTRDRQNRQITLSNYLMDFYISEGKTEPMTEVHGIRRSDVWRILYDFVLVLKRIRVVVEQLVPPGKDDAVEKTLTKLYATFSGYVDRFW